MQASPVMSLCLSFSDHCSGTLADIAERVIEELRNEPHPDWIELKPDTEDPFLRSREEEQNARNLSVSDDGDGDDQEFEFAFVTAEPNCSPISADEIFHNGRIKPVYPVGFRLSDGSDLNPRSETMPSGRKSLWRLMMEDRDATTSCSDDGAVSAGRNCSSSKRWRLRELVRQRNGDGQGNFVFFPPTGLKTAAEVKIVGEDKTTKEGGKRVSFQAQKQDLMGILANVNGLSRNLRPF